MEDMFTVGDMTLAQVIQVVSENYGTRAWVHLLEALPPEGEGTSLEIREWFWPEVDIMRIDADGTITVGFDRTRLPDDVDTWELIHSNYTTWFGRMPNGSMVILKDS